MSCDSWDRLIKECEGLYGNVYRDEHDGEFCTFFGLVHDDIDYYYGMMTIKDSRLRLLSCVGNFESHGFVLVEK